MKVQALLNPFLFLSYDFGSYALISSLLVGFSCSLLGSHVVLRKMSFSGAGLAHVAFAGVAFGFLTGIPPMAAALAFSLVASLIIWFFQVKKGIHFDVTMGTVFAVSMAFAVLFLSLSNAYGAKILSYLFGDPLAVERLDIVTLLFTALLSILFFLFFRREIYLISFSQEIAKASGYPVELITCLFNLLLALTVTLSIKAVGALLVFSLLVAPAASAYKVSKNYKQYVFFSVTFGIVSGIFGVLAAFALNAPPGATITVVSFLIFIVASIIRT